MSQIRVLVVDDDPWILRMVSSSLEKKGTYAVDTARDGQQALQKAQVQKPDMIISDVMMPVMDGWALVQQLRANPALSDIPVLFLTALGKDEDRLQALGLKPDDYVSKPFRFDDLERRVLKTLAKRGKIDDPSAYRQQNGGGFGQRGFGPAPGGSHGGGGGGGGFGPAPGHFGPGPGSNPQHGGYGQGGYSQGGGYDPGSFGPSGNFGPAAPPAPGAYGPPGGPPGGAQGGGYGYGPGYPNQGSPGPYSPPPGYGPPGAPQQPPPPPQQRPESEPSGVPQTVDPGSSGSFSGAMKRTGLSGRLEQLGLSSLLVMMEMERKDGVLQLQHAADKKVGRIFIRKGQVIQARVDKDPTERSGAESVYYMLTWAKGRFHFTAMDIEMEDEVQSSTTSLLMEGARLIDEANR